MPHRGSGAFRAVAGVCVPALAAVIVLGHRAERTEAGEATAAAMSVDTDITGNSAAVTGANDVAVALNPCDAFTFDVTVTDIPASTPMLGFGFTLNYDSDSVDIQGANSGYLLTVDPQSSLFDPGPSFSQDAAIVSAFDVGVNAEESGSGVLSRLSGVIPAGSDPGSYPLTLSDAAHLDPQNQTQPPDVLNNAAITIDGSCNGDVDCDLAVNSVDALKILRRSASLSVSQSEPCPSLGSDIGARNQGDVDCDGAVNSVDSLKVLRGVAGLPVSQAPPCPPIAP